MIPGYDPDFLETEVAIPRPPGPVRTLSYPRFSVLLDRPDDSRR
ncbi:hypothetical protein AB3M89_09045 [Microbacterium sp. 179-I 3D2 NHS]